MEVSDHRHQNTLFPSENEPSTNNTTLRLAVQTDKSLTPMHGMRFVGLIPQIFVSTWWFCKVDLHLRL